MTVHFERPTAFTFASQASTGAFYNKFLSALEGALTDIQTQVAAQAAQLVLITDAQTRLAIGLSWTTPSKVLTASDAGSDAKIDIISHLRVYADGLQNALPAQSITGLAYSTAYGVYYDATSLGDSSPTYKVTTDLPTAQHNYVPLRVLVGIVETPAAGAPAVVSGNTPPGAYSGPGSFNGGALP